MKIENTLNKLEFNQIKNILSNYCHTYLGKKLVCQLEPSFSKEEVSQKLAQTEEAIRLLYQNSVPYISEIADIAISLKMLEQSSVLSLKAILEIANILKLAQNLKDYFQKDYIDESNYPILSKLFSCLYTNKNITDRIFACVIDENTLDDNASSTLQSIRKKQRRLEQDIRSRLNEMIHSSKYAKYVQENVVTIRNDRFVIPIKEEYRSQIKGFVHDVSNAGSTLFIEPISVFEMNNEINQLKLEEEIEIEKILQELSNLFVPYVTELKLDCEIIGLLDFIFAKSTYAKNLDACIPILNDKKEIHLKNARHPLLDSNKVVPITLSLGDNFSTLLITGPNTGGKTVTLKTVGLLTCMACSGLAIPADEKSSIFVFDHIFADIGDDQSISDSLSTFSSHLLNIINIVKIATNNSLILVDELGSGTDPVEGANLAISILEYFHQKGALTIATTHYPELKKYALLHDDFGNASVSFDLATLSPTYQLLVGIPGKSNAFEISKRLGLCDEIIENAKSRMSFDDVRIEDLLKNIYEDKEKIEKEKLEISASLEEISTIKQNLKEKEKILQEQEKELLNTAKQNARNLLLDAKEEVTEILKQAKNTGSKRKLEQLRSNLNNEIKSLSPSPSSILSNASLSLEEATLNTKVFVPSLNQEGVIVSSPSRSNEVQVQIGNIKMNLPISALEKSKISNSSKKNKKENFGSYTSISKSRTVKTEINVIGYNVEEAVFVIDKFLDDCSLAKLQTVRIIHGKGTGKLRNGIHTFLKTNPHVKSFRLGSYGEGEMGVTVVELK